MRKIYLFVLVATIAFSGCKKDSVTPTASYTADVTIGSVKTNFTDMEHTVTVESGISYYSMHNWGSEMLTNIFYIYLANPVVGSLDFSDENYADIYIGSKTYYSKNASGKFTITKKDTKTISGTISGTFTDINDATYTITGNFASTLFDTTL